MAQKKNNFTYVPKNKLPKLKAIKTEWDLKKLYYKSEKDPQIEKDLKKTEKAYSDFANKWRNKPFTSNLKLLKEALEEQEKLAGLPFVTRPIRYFSFRSVLNTKDKVADKQLALISRRLRKVADSVLFFDLTIGSLPEKKQKEILNSKELEHFKYHLERLFLNSNYDLNEDQEKIINLKSRQSYSAWTEMTEKIISNRCILWQKKELPIPEALETLDTLPSRQKPKLWSLIIKEMEQIAEVAEHEFNAIITDVRTEDELRGYKKPYSSTAIGYEDDEKSIENLVEAVSNQGFNLSKKFYKLKAEYHKTKQLDYSQKYDSIGKETPIPFPEAVKICRDVFYEAKKEYGQIFDQMLTNGQIDVFPKKGKRGGAFMSDQTGHPVHVFLNHTNNFKSLETLAHEMGHAIHAHQSGKNTPFYDGHSITTAETASTLFENLVFDAVYEQADESQKTILLHDRITRDISTIQRQIACFNCELEFHNTIEKQGAMTKEELRDCMYKHLKSYLGPAVEIDKNDGYAYVYWSHLRYGFYVYTYSFGLLMSSLMAKNYREDRSYIEKIDQFLSSGSSANVHDIFETIGINTDQQNTFTEALKSHAEDIKKFEQLVKSRR